MANSVAGARQASPPPAPPVKSVRTGVLEIGYHESGDQSGVPVILLHGFPDDAHAYDGVLPLLAKAGLRAFAVYLRGYGPTRFLDTSDVVVRNNTIVDNNLPPFENAQGLVLTIPPGTGVMVLASQNTEVVGNTITNHKTTGVLVTTAISAQITFDPATLDEQGKPYDPFARGPHPVGVCPPAGTISRDPSAIPRFSYQRAEARTRRMGP